MKIAHVMCVEGWLQLPTADLGVIICFRKLLLLNISVDSVDFFIGFAVKLSADIIQGKPSCNSMGKKPTKVVLIL